jgi:hypothetical protein
LRKKKEKKHYYMLGKSWEIIYQWYQLEKCHLKKIDGSLNLAFEDSVK